MLILILFTPENKNYPYSPSETVRDYKVSWNEVSHFDPMKSNHKGLNLDSYGQWREFEI